MRRTRDGCLLPCLVRGRGLSQAVQRLTFIDGARRSTSGRSRSRLSLAGPTYRIRRRAASEGQAQPLEVNISPARATTHSVRQRWHLAQFRLHDDLPGFAIIEKLFHTNKFVNVSFCDNGPRGSGRTS